MNPVLELSREDIVTIAAALDEFRELGEPRLRNNFNELLRLSSGDVFLVGAAERKPDAS